MLFLLWMQDCCTHSKIKIGLLIYTVEKKSWSPTVLSPERHTKQTSQNQY